MGKRTYNGEGNRVKAGNIGYGAGGSISSSAYSGGVYFSKSADLNIPYSNNGRIRVGDLARRLLGNSGYGLFGRYALRLTGKSLYDGKEDKNRVKDSVRCPRCGFEVRRYNTNLF